MFNYTKKREIQKTPLPRISRFSNEKKIMLRKRYFEQIPNYTSLPDSKLIIDKSPMKNETEIVCLEQVQLLLNEAIELLDAMQSMPVIEY